MQEAEVKIVPIDRAKVEEKLKSLGASKTFDGEVETVFFDFPGGPIAKGKDLLRLRRKGGKSELTFKRFVADEGAKVREEYEVLVSDFERTRLILESIGLVGFQRMKKHRISYALRDGVAVDLDRYTGEMSHIPDVMEIEASDIATLRADIQALGFKPDECKTWTTFDLVEHYSDKRVKA
jgi:predicted adenylyl cyclase CyaB